MPANRDLFDLTVSHAIGLERYKAGLVQRVLRLLDRTEREVEEQLRAQLDKIIEDGGYNSDATTDRILRLMDGVEAVRQEGYAQLGNLLLEELTGLAQLEAEWSVAALGETIDIALDLTMPTAELLNAAITSRPFEGHILADWVEGMAPADVRRLQGAIQQGIVQGRTTPEIVQSIIGTRANHYEDGVLEISRRGAEGVARTAVNHVTTQAREAVAEANADIVEKVRIVATLDGRTTLVCISMDGKEFQVREGPRPPFHFRCRTTTIPVIDGVKLVGDRPAVTDTRDGRQRNIDFRRQARERAGNDWKRMSERQRRTAIQREREAWAAQAIGQVPRDTTYAQWLARQPAAFQDEVLGPTRAQLYRTGGLSVDRFVDASGHQYTLDELRRREAAAFRRAKL